MLLCGVMLLYLFDGLLARVSRRAAADFGARARRARAPPRTHTAAPRVAVVATFSGCMLALSWLPAFQAPLLDGGAPAGARAQPRSGGRARPDVGLAVPGEDGFGVTSTAASRTATPPSTSSSARRIRRSACAATSRRRSRIRAAAGSSRATAPRESGTATSRCGCCARGPSGCSWRTGSRLPRASWPRACARCSRSTPALGRGRAYRSACASRPRSRAARLRASGRSRTPGTVCEPGSNPLSGGFAAPATPEPRTETDFSNVRIWKLSFFGAHWMAR